MRNEEEEEEEQEEKADGKLKKIEMQKGRKT